MRRSTWDETWMGVAAQVAKRSACEHSQVGAVIVDPSNRPIATGYNGPPSGLQIAGPCRGWCPREMARNQVGFTADPKIRNCPSVHAEANALLFADRRELVGGTIYITREPCYECAKLIANSGLTRVVMTPYDGVRTAYQHAASLLTHSGLKLDRQEIPS